MSRSAEEAIVSERLVDWWIFSIDGADPGGYRRYRVGGDFERAFSNLVRAHRRATPAGIRVTWQYVVFPSGSTLRARSGARDARGTAWSTWRPTCGRGRLAVLLLDPGDTVWVEDPGYPGARAAFELAGARIARVPVDDEGMRVEVGVRAAPRARLAYLTPSHQYPTGVALSLDRRIALLDWAARENAWVVEDDYDGEFRYGGRPLAALCSLDPRARVLYVGTLSKATFVSPRLAYAVVPEDVVEPLANVRTQLDGFTPALPQMAMSAFMEEGHLSAHLRRMRAAYGAKRAELVEGLAPLAARGWTWSANPAGLHLLVRHPAGTYVRGIPAASSLDLALLSSYRIRPARDDGLFLRFGGLSPASIRSGVAALVAAERRVSEAGSATP